MTGGGARSNKVSFFDEKTIKRVVTRQQVLSDTLVDPENDTFVERLIQEK